MLYRCFRWLLSFALSRFFDRINIKGAAPIEEGPLVIIAPHPFSGMDPFVVVKPYRRTVDFVAKAPLFERPLKARFYRALRMHPIHRAQDGAGLQEMKENLRQLENMAKLVADGGAVLIFIEGQSNRTRRVIDELMDGPAKIILDAQALLDARGNGEKVKVQVVGQTYGDFDEPFGSSVTLNFMPEFSAADYIWGAAAKKRERRSAYEAVTKKCGELLRESIAEVSGSEAPLIERIQKFYHCERADDDQKRIQAVSAAVQRMLPGHEAEASELQAELDEYLSLARALKVRAGEERRPSLSSCLAIAIWPLVWLGCALHLPPYLLTRWRANSSNTHPVDLAYAKLSLGVRNFSAWYFMLAVLFLTLFVAAELSLLSSLGAAAAALSACVLLGVLGGSYLRSVNPHIWRLFRLPAFKRYCRLGAQLHERLEEFRQAAGDANQGSN